MNRLTFALLLAGCAPALGGCVASMAASAVGMAARGAIGKPVSNQHLQPTAASACRAHAAQYGAVHIIDVVQSSTSKITVWGTTGDGTARRSFECSYGSTITAFKLRAITPPR